MLTLPGDVLYIILDLLKAERDHGTLFQCALSSRWLAEPCLSVLYQLYDTSPVSGGGTEDEQFRTRRAGAGPYTISTSIKNDQNPIMRKWALMWRSIILSTFEDKTYLPYYSYIRYLDLNDLKELLIDSGFRDNIREEFFSDDIGDYVFRDYESKGNKRLRFSKNMSMDTNWVVERVGAAITKKAQSVSELRGDIPPQALKEWVRELPKLQALSLWNGSSFGQGAEEDIRDNCQEFKNLALYRLDGPQVKADPEAERVLKGLRSNSLESFEVLSSSHLGPRSIAALGSHLEALTELKLTSLPIEAIAELPSLKTPTALKVLVLTDSHPQMRNEYFYDTVSAVADWICTCANLRHLELRRFVDDANLLSIVLVDERVHLHTLHVRGYKMETAREFHRALALQPSLQVLSLEGEGSEIPQDQAVLVQAIGQLSELRELELKDISEYFTSDHVMTLTPYLPKLERLWISGYDFDDDLWDSFLCLPNLRYLIIHALSSFTAPGILDFVSRLGPSNQGFSLSILNALTELSIPEDALAVIRESLAHNVNGNLDYELAREEYTDSESGSNISG